MEEVGPGTSVLWFSVGCVAAEEGAEVPHPMVAGAAAPSAGSAVGNAAVPARSPPAIFSLSPLSGSAHVLCL